MDTSYVVEGAKLKCSCGDEESDLNVTNKSVRINKKPQANIMDFKPMVNVSPFGKCRSLANPTVAAATARNKGRLKKMPCVPATVTPWIGSKDDVLINNCRVLLSTSTLRCMWNGTISITDDGQD